MIHDRWLWCGEIWLGCPINSEKPRPNPLPPARRMLSTKPIRSSHLNCFSPTNFSNYSLLLIGYLCNLQYGPFFYPHPTKSLTIPKQTITQNLCFTQLFWQRSFSIQIYPCQFARLFKRCVTLLMRGMTGETSDNTFYNSKSTTGGDRYPSTFHSTSQSGSTQVRYPTLLPSCQSSELGNLTSQLRITLWPLELSEEPIQWWWWCGVEVVWGRQTRWWWWW